MDREKLLIIGEEDRIGKIIEIMEERQVIDIQTPAQVLFEFLEALVADDVEFMDDLEKMLDLKENEMSEDVNEIPKDFEKYILSTRKELMVWNRYYKQLNEMGGVLSDSPNDIVDGDAREMFRFLRIKWDGFRQILRISESIRFRFMIYTNPKLMYGRIRLCSF